MISEARVEEVLPLLSSPVALVTLEGNVAVCNAEFARVAADPGDLSDILSADDLTALSNYRKDALATSEPLVLALKGEVKERLLVTAVARVGEVLGFLYQIVPTERTDAGGHDLLLDHLDLGVWDYDASAETFTISDAWCRMRGYVCEEGSTLSLSGWLDLVHAKDRDRVRMMLEGQPPDDQRNAVVRYRWRHADGRWIWILSRVSVMGTDDAGCPTKVVGTDAHVKDADESEESLFHLTGKLQLAIEASGMGIWEFDPSTGRVHWDDRLLEIYGILDGENVRSGSDWALYLHPEDRVETVAYAEECERSSGEFKGDFRIVRPDGQVRYVRSLSRSVTTGPDERRLIGVNIDVTSDYLRAQELELARRRLEYDSRHDALTGLGNRRKLDEMALALFNQLGPEDRFTVMQLDLDHFKLVNDTQGHAAGDHVLSVVARVLRKTVGEAGQVFRVGGDEFVVLFEKALPEGEMRKLSGALIEAVSQPISFDGEPCAIGASIGYSTQQGPPDSPSEPFSNADTALYAAKRAGRSCFKAFVPQMVADALAVPNSRQALTQAIRNGEMICHYQPQYDAKTLRIIGAEALVRWQCADRGLLTPDKFLGRIEEYNLLKDLDAAVFRLVLEQQDEWAETGVPFPSIAINTSKERLTDDRLMVEVEAMLKPHHRIGFELLETAFYDRIDTALAFKLDTLRDMGIVIALDDFGSGHSSIAALQALQPNRVKIDRCLVHPIQTNPDQMLTLQSLSRIARLEAAEVAVEGLETGLQLAAIRNLDCDVLQGYTLQRPMTALEFTALLRREGTADEITPAASG